MTSKRLTNSQKRALAHMHANDGKIDTDSGFSVVTVRSLAAADLCVITDERRVRARVDYAAELTEDGWARKPKAAKQSSSRRTTPAQQRALDYMRANGGHLEVGAGNHTGFSLPTVHALKEAGLVTLTRRLTGALYEATAWVWEATLTDAGWGDHPRPEPTPDPGDRETPDFRHGDIVRNLGSKSVDIVTSVDGHTYTDKDGAERTERFNTRNGYGTVPANRYELVYRPHQAFRVGDTAEDIHTGEVGTISDLMTAETQDGYTLLIAVRLTDGYTTAPDDHWVHAERPAHEAAPESTPEPSPEPGVPLDQDAPLTEYYCGETRTTFTEGMRVTFAGRDGMWKHGEVTGLYLAARTRTPVAVIDSDCYEPSPSKPMRGMPPRPRRKRPRQETFRARIDRSLTREK